MNDAVSVCLSAVCSRSTTQSLVLLSELITFSWHCYNQTVSQTDRQTDVQTRAVNRLHRVNRDFNAHFVCYIFKFVRVPFAGRVVTSSDVGPLMLNASLRLTTCLENLEMSGNLTAVREMSGIFAKSQGNVRGKSCQGKVA